MIILGVDPGYAIVGLGAVEYRGSKFRVIEHGAVTTDAHTPFAERLLEISQQMDSALARIGPDAVAVEELFFARNTTTAIAVAQARGVILLAAARHGIPVREYTPLQVKQAVVGYGRAEKRQVMEMTRILLGLAAVPKPDDAADALAVAVCCAHSANAHALLQSR